MKREVISDHTSSNVSDSEESARQDGWEKEALLMKVDMRLVFKLTLTPTEE